MTIDFTGRRMFPGDIVRLRMGDRTWDVKNLGLVVAIEPGREDEKWHGGRCHVMWSGTQAIERRFSEELVILGGE